MTTRVMILFGIMIGTASAALGYDIESHGQMSLAAAASSSVRSILGALQLSDSSLLDAANTGRPFNKGTAFGWIQEGAVREDGDSNCDDRVRNHFYNPITNTGYSRFGIITGIESALWGLEDSTTAISQDFSYRDARGYFWDALTASSDSARQRKLALTFRSLGQVMHLVQDAAQPQHSRNDSHAGLVCPTTLGLLGPQSLYELYVETNAVVGSLTYSGYPIVDLPEPRFYWDTEDGRGIAEFSNRNFVTVGTNFTGTPDDVQPAPGFPSPNAAGSQVFQEDIQTLLPGSPLTGKMSFIGTPWYDGYSGASGFNNRTSTFSIFTDDLGRRGVPVEYSLNVFNYANAQQLLIPRAVGYSAGVLNYFFRGTLEIAPPDRFSYLVASYEKGSGTFTKLKVKLRNVTAGADTGVGTMQAIIRYRKTYLANPLLYPGFSGLESEASYLLSKPIDNASLSRDFQPFEFDFSESPLPVMSGDVSVIIAFRGPLISPAFTENDAIAFGGKDVFEPQLIDFGNSTDYDCYQDALYDVVGLTPQQRDVNSDGLQDLFGPSTMNGAFIRLQAYYTPVRPLTSETANYEVPGFSWAEYSRFVAVQGDPQYFLVYSSPDVVDTYSGSRSPHLSYFGLARNINRLVEQDGKLVHEVSAYSGFTYRGTTSPLHMDLVNIKVANSSPCRNSMWSVPRPMAEIPGTVSGQND